MLPRLRRKHYLAGLLLIVLASAGGYTAYQAVDLPSQTSDESELQTTTVRQGDLVIYASGSGTLVAVEEIELGFGASGPVAELNVKVGDVVEAGDVLAVQGEREMLEAAVAADQLAVLNAREALQTLQDSAARVTAQAALDLAAAREELRSAEYTWQVRQEGYRASELTIEAAEAELVLAERELEKAKSEYNKYSGRADDDPSKALALTKLSSAQTKYDSALRNLNWYTGSPTEIEQAQLDAELALAQAAVAEAERAYARVEDGPDPDELAKAELQLANAEANLAISERNLEASTLLAPASGTILAVDAEVGQTVSGAFITLADLSRLYVEVFLDETDMDKVGVGFEVEVIFDALPDAIFTGQMVQIDPSLRTSGQVSTVAGLAQLDATSGLALDSLLLGMNAAVDVIGGRAEGVALVPIEALRELSPGEYVVFVMEAGVPRLRPVEVGLMDFSFAEIRSGLEIGEVISTGIVETG